MCHRPERVIIGRRNIWGIWRVGKNFPFERFQVGFKYGTSSVLRVVTHRLHRLCATAIQFLGHQLLETVGRAAARTRRTAATHKPVFAERGRKRPPSLTRVDPHTTKRCSSVCSNILALISRVGLLRLNVSPIPVQIVEFRGAPSSYAVLEKFHGLAW